MRRALIPLGLALLVAPILVAALLVAAIPGHARADTCRAESPAHTVALVELYTSQGCSSCPAADRWLSRLPDSTPADRAIPLSLHVGYWDYIGWADPFAKRAFNDRQRTLARLAGSRSVYTPGVFVSGTELRQWSTPARFDGALQSVAAEPAAARLALAARMRDTEVEVDVAVTRVAGPPLAGAELHVALKQHGHLTDVRAGENRGERLANDHVVREWSGPLAAEPSQTVRLPLPGDGPRRFEVVAFLQARGSSRILQALALPLAGCPPSRVTTAR